MNRTTVGRGGTEYRTATRLPRCCNTGAGPSVEAEELLNRVPGVRDDAAEKFVAVPRIVPVYHHAAEATASVDDVPRAVACRTTMPIACNCLPMHFCAMPPMTIDAPVRIMPI